ncbi:MAG: Tol-Pal system beta propeller repeat protein TolB [Desulfobacterales bacterium]|nr:Tol-Pal system beta propeller repeat protein TolB [Desulfobacterales bacterium]
MKIILIIAVINCLASSSKAEKAYINISNPFLKKVPIAVPIFKNLSVEGDSNILIEGADLIASTLDFTSYFRIIERKNFLEQADAIGITISDIKFQNWKTIGADFIITGGLKEKDSIIDLELRLFDRIEEKMILGRKYTGRITDLKTIIRKFCNEVILILSNNKGIFETKIAFVSTGTGNKEIYMCDFNGDEPKQVTNNKAITLSPALSSDGNWIAYTSYLKGKPDLYIKHLKENRGSVVSFEGINISPAWLPGQAVLGATLSKSGDPEIYLISVSGKIVKRLTNSWGIDVSPTFSPEGKKMAFVSKRSGTPQIFIQNVESGDAERITFEGQYNTCPAWSPNGNKIAYTAMIDGKFNICLIDIKTKEVTQLTKDSGDNEDPSWSPEGNFIVFSSTREGSSRIYVMTALGTNQRRLIMMQGDQSSPEWSNFTVNIE